MTKKLSKNVSMYDRYANPGDLCFKKKINLRNVTKAFEMILTKHGARESFFINWAKQNLLFCEGSFFKMWKKTRKCYRCGNWIGKAFVWSKTEEGYEYWKKVNTDWEKWVNQYVIGNHES